MRDWLGEVFFFCGEKRLTHNNTEIRDIKNKDSNLVLLRLGQRDGRRLYNMCVSREVANGLCDLLARPVVS